MEVSVGETLRARVQVALGLRTMQVSGMLERLKDGQTQNSRHAEITWSLFMLDRIFIGLEFCSPSLPPRAFERVIFPKISAEEVRAVKGFRAQPNEAFHSEPRPDCISIVATTAELLRVWEDVIWDISITGEDAVPAWEAGSRRTKIASRLFQLEIRKLKWLSEYTNETEQGRNETTQLHIRRADVTGEQGARPCKILPSMALLPDLALRHTLLFVRWNNQILLGTLL